MVLCFFLDSFSFLRLFTFSVVHSQVHLINVACTSKTKMVEERISFLEKENERLPENADNLRKKLTKAEDLWDYADRQLTALQKTYKKSQEMINNLREVVIHECDATKKAESKATSLETRL